MNFRYHNGHLIPIKKKCKKLMITGEVCGKAIGSCIHHWRPTQFGKRESNEKDTVL